MEKPKRGFRAFTVVAFVICSFCLGLLLRGGLSTSNDGLLSGETGRAYVSRELPGSFAPLDLFYEVFRHLRTHYVEPITDQTPLSHGVLRGMASYFSDPLTRFLSPDEAKRLERMVAGHFEGIGAVVEVRPVHEPVTDPDMRAELARLIKAHKEQGEPTFNIGFTENTITKNYVTVVAVVPGGGGAAAGLRPGDIVDAIDGRWIISYNITAVDLLPKTAALRNRRIKRHELMEAARALEEKLENALTAERALELLTTTTKPVELRIVREGASTPIEVKVEPKVVSLPAVEWEEIEKGTGYIRISAFSSDAPAQFRSAVNALRSRDVERLVIDVRDNALGSTAEMLQIAGMLLGGTTLVRFQKKQNDPELVPIRTPSGEPIWTGPIAVLVNRGSANLAELFAISLKDKRDGLLVGSRTAGDTMARGSVRLQDGAVLLFPTGKFFSLAGKDFSSIGLKPDVEVATARGDSPPGKDPAVRQAVSLLKVPKEPNGGRQS